MIAIVQSRSRARHREACPRRSRRRRRRSAARDTNNLGRSTAAENPSAIAATDNRSRAKYSAKGASASFRTTGFCPLATFLRVQVLEFAPTHSPSRQRSSPRRRRTRELQLDDWVIRQHHHLQRAMPLQWQTPCPTLPDTLIQPSLAPSPPRGLRPLSNGNDFPLTHAAHAWRRLVRHETAHHPIYLATRPPCGEGLGVGVAKFC